MKLLSSHIGNNNKTKYSFFHTGYLLVIRTSQGCRQLFRTGWANKVKTKELQFSSRGRVREWDMPPPA